MDKETIKKVREILKPFGYEVKPSQVSGIYLSPNFEDYVYIEFVDGIFMLKNRNHYYTTDRVDAIISDMKKYKTVAKQLNELLEQNGDKKTSILEWQEKIDKAGLGLNQNGNQKFWNIVRSYGLESGTNGSPEFTELWLWDNELYTAYLSIDEETKTISIVGGIYDEEGNPVEDISSETLIEKLKIKDASKHDIVFELEQGLGIRIHINPEESIFLERSFIKID